MFSSSLFRSASVLFFGNMFGFACMLARNLLIARLVSVEDYGIAVTFGIILSMVEVLSQIGLLQLIVQRADGDEPRVQAALQAIQAVRGLISSFVLFVFAPHIAGFMNIPEVEWAFRVVALVPLIRSVGHFDMHRIQRQNDFRPMVTVFSLSALISVSSAYPLYLAFGDYRTMLFALIIESVAWLALSHVVAHRRFSIVFDKRVTREALRFGWPLLINAVFLFVVMQGEKMIVGRELGVATLALFAMGFTLTLTPTLVASRCVNSLALPRLSRIERGSGAFQELAQFVTQVYMLGGIGLMVLALLFGPFFVDLVLGEKYQPLATLLPLFAILHGVRMFKSGPAIVALSDANSMNSLAGNLARAALFPLFWWLAAQGTAIEKLLFIAIAGEAVGFAVTMVMIRNHVNLRSRSMMLSIASTVMIALLVTLDVLSRLDYGVPDWSYLVPIALVLGLFTVSLKHLWLTAWAQMR